MDEDEIMGIPLEEEDAEDDVPVYRTYRMDVKIKELLAKLTEWRRQHRLCSSPADKKVRALDL